MDVIRFELRPPMEEYWNDQALHILINGDHLIDLVREIERPFALKEGSPEIAGAYDGLPVSEIGSAKDHFLGRPQPILNYGAKTVLLGCTCGIVDCWPLLARVVVGDRTVTWSDFEQPHRRVNSAAGEWRYDDFGPFVFDRDQYVAELERVDQELGC